MAEIRHIDVHEFWKKNMRYPEPVDYPYLVKPDLGGFKECRPDRGKLFLVTDIKVKGAEYVSRGGFVSWNWITNEVFTKWGMARTGDLIAEGSLQFDNRDELLERLLGDKRIRKVGKYDPQAYFLDASFVTEIRDGVMKEDFAEFNRRENRGPQPQPWEHKPHPRNTVTREQLERYSPIHVGLEIYRVLPGQKITARFGVCEENDELGASCIGQLDPEASARSAVDGKLIERVGKWGKSTIPWEEGKLIPIYDKGKAPEFSAWEE